jgi:Putative zinc-binding metallo-peptidase
MKTDLTKWALFLGIILVLMSCTKTYTDEEIDNLFKPLTSEYGIKIIYKIDDNFLSPIESIVPLTGPAKSSIVKPIDLQVLARYPTILKEAFKKYPVQVIKKYLTAIHFAKEINMDGVTCGASYDLYRRVVFLVNDGSQSDGYSIGSFHHEFNSILLNRHGFYINHWIDKNPKGFKYLYKTYGELKNLQRHMEVSVQGTKNDYEMGFMNSYGQTNFENDFNEYAAMVFAYPQKFKKIMNQFPRVRGKFLVFLEFYHKIDPIFTEEYLLGEKK